MTIKLTVAQLDLASDLAKRRASIVEKLTRLDRNRAGIVSGQIKFGFKSEQDFSEYARGGTRLVNRLLDATIEHFKEDLAEVNLQLESLGVEIEG